MKSKTVNLLSAVFIGATLGFYLIILGGFSNHKNVMTYIPVALALLYSLVILSNDKRSWLLTLALLFTAVSDVFLMLVTPINQSVAMFTFSIAQICHFLRLYADFKSKKERVIHIVIRVVLCIIVELIAVIVVGSAFDIVVALSVFYFVNLTLNLITAFIYFNNSWLFAVGLLCFILCDIFVGFSAGAGVYLDIPKTSILYNIAYPNFDYVSLFYVPSQMLIALSGNKFIVKSGSLYKKLFKR